MDFIPFRKIPRLAREITITEKIDGTNAQVNIRPALDPVTGISTFDSGIDVQIEIDGFAHYMRAGSRTRWLSSQQDNAGFHRWMYENAYELAQLGPGAHFGEWWGQGIQRRYGLDHKRFSLFNAGRWVDAVTYSAAAGVACFALKQGILVAPDCCGVVPVLYSGPFSSAHIEAALNSLEFEGSRAAPGFDNPEGIVVFHTAAGQYFKKTIDRDDVPKARAA
jgi:hypothetical protein